MREITIDGKELRVRATPLALLYYKQEFNCDLLGDLVKMQEIETDPGKIDAVAVLQMTWAMAKADSPKGFPGFEKWLSGFGSFDITTVFMDVMEEAADGFFRRRQGAPGEEKPAKPKGSDGT